jgi:hypothetical protein
LLTHCERNEERRCSHLSLSRSGLGVGDINEYVNDGAAELLMEPSVFDAEVLVE